MEIHIAVLIALVAVCTLSGFVLATIFRSSEDCNCCTQPSTSVQNPEMFVDPTEPQEFCRHCGNVDGFVYEVSPIYGEQVACSLCGSFDVGKLAIALPKILAKSKEANASI